MSVSSKEAPPPSEGERGNNNNAGGGNERTSNDNSSSSSHNDPSSSSRSRKNNHSSFSSENNSNTRKDHGSNEDDDEDDSEYEYESDSEEDDDSSDDENDEDDDTNDVDVEGSWKQHVVALIIGFVAAVIGYYFINPQFYNDLLNGEFSSLWSTSGGKITSLSSTGNYLLSEAQQRRLKQQESKGPTYKRTWGLQFCLPTRPELRDDLYVPKKKTTDQDGNVIVCDNADRDQECVNHIGTDSSFMNNLEASSSSSVPRPPIFCTSQITERAMKDDNKKKKHTIDDDFPQLAQSLVEQGRSWNWNDPQMTYVNMTLPKHLLEALMEHYHEDYPHLFDMKNDLSYEAKSAELIPIKVYKEPSVDSFYKNPEGRQLLLEHQRKEKEEAKRKDNIDEIDEAAETSLLALPPGDDILEEVEPLFTGFAAKVTNLHYKPMNLWWDGGYTEDEEGRNIKQDILVGTIAPFESIGTASFSGHQFYMTPTYDRSDHLSRFVLSNDPDDGQPPAYVFDPFSNPPTGSGVTQFRLERLSKQQRRLYDMHQLNMIYGRSYQLATNRPWYGMFPRPPPSYPMWSADYFGQTHHVSTKHTYYHTIPQNLSRLNSEKMARRELSEHVPTYQSSDETLDLTLKVMSCRPRVFEISNFLSDVEVEHLIKLGQENGRMKDSTVSATGEEEGASTAKNTRSSTNGWIFREESSIVDTIYRRAADVMQIHESLLRDHWTDQDKGPTSQGGDDSDDDEDAPLRIVKRHRKNSDGSEDEEEELKLHEEWATRAEALQLVHYEQNQRYTAHHDFTFPLAGNPYQPTRFATMLFYLNGGEEKQVKEGDDDTTTILKGGETAFPRGRNAESPNGLAIQPQKGKAVLFYNMLPDGNMDDLSQHASMPVLSGEKWLANLWIWDPVMH